MLRGIIILSAIAVSAVFATLIAAAVPPISEDFRVDIIEVDDTEGGDVVLRQTIAESLSQHRLKMTAHGSLVEGYLEQVTDCGFPWSGAQGSRGIFTEVGGRKFGPDCMCKNITLDGEQWSNFWAFPSNASYEGLQPIPKSNKHAHMWMYWMDHDVYHFFAEIGNATQDAVTPLWEGKVKTWHPGYHLWHIEYVHFVAGQPPAHAFQPAVPAGVSCPTAPVPAPPPPVLQMQQRQQGNTRRWKIASEKGLPMF